MTTLALTFGLKIVQPLAYADALGRVFEEVRNNTISHEGGVWVVRTKDGHRVLGKHKTREEAEQQLRAIEESKASHYAVDDEGQEGAVKKENLPAYFAQIDKKLDALEALALEALREILSEARDRLITQVRRGSTSAKSFRLARVPALRSALRDLLERAQQRGRDDAVDDLGNVKAFAKPLSQFAPRQAMKWLRAKEFFITDLLDSQITEAARGVLVNALKSGELAGRTVEKLWLLFEPYVGDPSVLRDGSPLSPHRLETIVRTNTVEAYNHGRMMEYTREEMLPFLTALRYSAILDTRTTPVCQHLHGKLFDPISPDLTDLLPPNHFNCRSIIVPVMVGEKVKQEDFATDADIGRAKELADARFLVQDDSGHEGVWRTVRGRKVFIREGEDLDSALGRALGADAAASPSKGVPRTLSGRERYAIDAYKATDYYDINEKLRKGNVDALSKNQHDIVTILDRLTSESTTADDTTVYRVIDGKRVGDKYLKVGAVVEDKAFMSTSTSEHQAKGAVKDTGASMTTITTLEIRVPKGSRAFDASAEGPKAIIAPRSGESELLFSRGTRLRVVSVDVGARHVIAELLPSDAKVFAQDWDESLHPRHPAGSDQGGEFAPKSAEGSASQSRDPRVQRLREISKLPGTKASVELLEAFDVPPPPLESAYVEVVAGYVYNEYTRLNHELRTSENLDTANLPDVQKTRLRTLDAAIENAVSLQESVTVYRGVAGDFNLKEGDIFEDRGFLSTSASEKLGRVFGDTVFEIEAPPGTKFIPVAPYLKSADRAAIVGRDSMRLVDNAINHAMAEAELLFARGTKMRIKGVQTSLDGKHSYYKAEIVK